MKLAELEPRWMLSHDGREGIGVSFLCPRCRTSRIYVAFGNPIDGGPPVDAVTRWWNREGATFETLSLSPSIDASAIGHWHGYVTNGEVTGC